jgi:hypothetical protein
VRCTGNPRPTTQCIDKTAGVGKFVAEKARQRVIAPGKLLAFGLERSDAFCLEALWTFRHVELDLLAFLQAAKAACLDGRKMHENIVARLAADEAEAFGVVKPFHDPLFHLYYLFL